MTIILAVASILVITGLAYLLNKLLPFQVCPTCAGVAGTWLLMLAFRFFGYPISSVILALLMGGSVIGIAYQLEKRLLPGRSPILFKTLFYSAGFAAAYGLIVLSLGVAAIALVVLVVISFVFLRQSVVSKERTGVAKELEKKLEECC